MGYARVSTQETKEEIPENDRRTPLTTFEPPRRSWDPLTGVRSRLRPGTLSPATLVRNDPLACKSHQSA